MTSLSHLRKLLAKGTPGEWNVEWSDPGWEETPEDRRVDYIRAANGDEVVVADSGVYPPHGHTASLIATSHNALPALLEIAEAAVRWRDAVSDSERGAAILALSNATFKVKP